MMMMTMVVNSEYTVCEVIAPYNAIHVQTTITYINIYLCVIFWTMSIEYISFGEIKWTGIITNGIICVLAISGKKKTSPTPGKPPNNRIQGLFLVTITMWVCLQGEQYDYLLSCQCLHGMSMSSTYNMHEWRYHIDIHIDTGSFTPAIKNKTV